MCLILFSLNAHPHFPLILAANRDEFYERPATAAHFWREAPLLLAGRDEQGGGTWCGITRNGRFAALTNHRDLRTLKQNAPTRGHLLTRFLLGSTEEEASTSSVHINLMHVNDVYPAHRSQTQNIRSIRQSMYGDAEKDMQQFGAWLDANTAQYNGYNILFGIVTGKNSSGKDVSANGAQRDVQYHLWYQSNVGVPAHPLEAGIYGLSNALLDTPWHKVERGKERFRAVLANYDAQSATQPPYNNEEFSNEPYSNKERRQQLTQDLLAALYDEQQAHDEQLPDTGVGVEMERLLSSMFIRSERYGTRNSTVILLDREGTVSFTERIYDTPYSSASEQSFTFTIVEESVTTDSISI